MATYIESQDQTKPAGNRDLSLGDDDMREMKRAYDERLDQDHVKPADETGYTTVGYHKKSTYVKQASNPTAVNDAGIVYSKDAGGDAIELYYIDDDSNVIQFTNAGKVRAESLGGVYPAANLAALATMMNLIYPVGIVLTLGVSTNPATLLGIGTWTAIAGTVIVGISGSDTEFDTLDETGGAKTVTLTSAQSGVPAHTHATTNTRNANGWSSGDFFQGSENSGSPSGLTLTVAANVAADAASAHSNLQPYIVKYVWQRTA